MVRINTIRLEETDMRTTTPALVALLGLSLALGPIGCEPEDIPTYEIDVTFDPISDEDTYRDLQEIMQIAYGTATQAALHGYIVPTHIFATVTGNGFTLARHTHIDEFDRDKTYPLTQPTLLFYAPTGRPTFESAGGTYYDVIPDPPYELIGWAYSFNYDPDERPSLPGVPSAAWFVHEAGWHLRDGGFSLTPPEEDYPGEVYIEAAPAGSEPSNGVVWHQRIWDLHMWIDPDEVPIMSVFEPFDSLPEGTLDLPEGTFFYPTFTP